MLYSYSRVIRCSVATLVCAVVVVVGCDKSGGGGSEGTDGHPVQAAPDQAAAVDDAPWFVEITADAGINFIHESGGTGEYFTPEVTGSGCALFDADGDGDLDAYLINANWFDQAGLDESPVPINQFFRQDESGIFHDATAGSGLGNAGYGMGVAVGDIDNDGDRDVYVTNLGGDRLYRNRGDGTFKDATSEGGIDVPGWSCSAAFLDFDRDGDLDLYVTQYLNFDQRKVCFDATGMRDYCAPSEFRPVSDVLLENDGTGRFIDASKRAGITTVAAPGLGVACDDFDGDGWIDIYIANDAHPNNLWINNGDGTFRDDAVVLGVAYNMHGEPEASMGIIAEDLDGNGSVDLFLTHFSEETNTFYRNLGGGRGFIDATGVSGLGKGNMSYTGFGTAALDIERDGDLDLLAVNGATLRRERLDGAVPAPPWDRYAEPNLVYMNQGDGQFINELNSGGAFTGQVEISRGLATGDIDNDGDEDLLVSNVQGPARLYRNDAPRAGHWLRIRCVLAEKGGRDAIGAQVVLTAGDRRWVGTIHNGFSYLSSRPAVLDFGLGEVTTLDGIDIRWPDGTTERFTGVGIDQTVTLTQGGGEA